MGIIELQEEQGLLSAELLIKAVIHCYGDAASEMISNKIASDINRDWNACNASIIRNNKPYKIKFQVQGLYSPLLTPEEVYNNDNPVNNYFRVEEYVSGDISFVDGIGSNTGYFKLDNILGDSTTASHEFGHTIGLEHPVHLDLRGKGVPGIMYPRGTLTDPEYQYDPLATAGTVGGTMHPLHRKVLLADIELLRLEKIKFNTERFAVLGDFSSVWHPRHKKI